MEITSPSGKTYQWSGTKPPTAEDIAQLQSYEAKQNPSAQAAQPAAQPAAAPAQAPDWFHSDHAIAPPGMMFGGVNVNPAGVLNAAKDMGMEGGGIALGQAAGAPFAEFGGVQVGGAVGGFLGSVAAQLSNFADPNSHFSLGRAVANAGVGAIPGSFLAKPGVSLARKALTLGAANVGATNAQSLIDEGEPASLMQDAVAFGGGTLAAVGGNVLNNGNTAAETARKMGEGAVKRGTLTAAREAGLVFPPSATNPNAINNTLQSAAGKAATAQEAILRNQPVVNDIVRSEVGIPSGTAISPVSLNTAKVGPNLVYDEVSKMTMASQSLLDNFKQASADANSAWAAYRASPIKDPAVKAAAEASDALADAMKNALKREAQKVKNGNDIMQRFDNARVRLAKIGLAGEALNQGSGDIDAVVIGRAFDRSPAKLTDGMKTIGAAQQAFGKYIKDAATTPPSGVDYLKMLGKIGAGGVGFKLGGLTGAALGAGGAMAAEKGARSLILSPAYQRAFGSPYYGSTAPNFTSELAKYGTAAGSRKN